MGRKLSKNFNGRAGVYAGSFDPITRGHLDIIFQAAKLMDRLYVVVGVNTSKQPLFTGAERVAMIRAEIADEVLPRLKKMGLSCDIRVAEHGGLTAQFMKANGAPFYIRGLRMGMEFDAEYPALVAGQGEYADFTPVFLCTTDPHLQIVSSSLARELGRFGGKSLERYVTKRVAAALEERIAARGPRIS